MPGRGSAEGLHFNAFLLTLCVHAQGLISSGLLLGFQFAVVKMVPKNVTIMLVHARLAPIISHGQAN